MSDEVKAPEEKKAPRRFSRKLKHQPVLIEEEDGRECEYTLVEIRGPQRDAFMSRRDAYVKVVNGEKELDVSKMSEIMAELLGMALRDPSGNPVPAGVIKEFPSDMQMELFKDAAKLSGLDRQAGEAAKNA